MRFMSKFLDISERPDGFGKKFEDIDGLFTSNYLFASNYIKDKIILDSGCGAGYGAFFLSKKASKVIAIDYHKKTIKKNKKMYNKSNLFFECMDGTNLSFENNFFDVIVSFEVIEHIQYYRKYLAECMRVLKKGGVFVLSTPNKKKFSPNTKKPIIVNHFQEFIYSRLFKLLNKYFKNVKIYGKHIVSSEYNQKINNKRYKKKILLERKLASVPLIRKISRFVPLSIRRLVNGYIDHKLNLEDIKISIENIEEAKEFLAICKK